MKSSLKLLGKLLKVFSFWSHLDETRLSKCWGLMGTGNTTIQCQVLWAVTENKSGRHQTQNGFFSLAPSRTSVLCVRSLLELQDSGERRVKNETVRCSAGKCGLEIAGHRRT